jgi:hypothetical protein
MAALHPRRDDLDKHVSRVVLRAHMRHDTLAHGRRIPSNMIAYDAVFVLQHRLGTLGVMNDGRIVPIDISWSTQLYTHHPQLVT